MAAASVKEEAMGQHMSRAMWVLVSFALASRIAARDLTFEDRIKAQEAIERVYYAHQIGATRPFEEAVPVGDGTNRCRILTGSQSKTIL